MLLSHWVLGLMMESFFFFSSRRRHTRCSRDWSSDVCSSDLHQHLPTIRLQKPDHVLEQHTLAAAALADHRGDLPPGHIQIHSLQDWLPPERLFHPSETNHRRGCSACGFRSREFLAERRFHRTHIKTEVTN